MHLSAACLGDEDSITAPFGATFSGPNEARQVERVRASGAALVEPVAESPGSIVGQKMLARILRPNGWLLRAPVAAAPERPRSEIRSARVLEAVAAVRAGGWNAGVADGNSVNDERSGFSVAVVRRLASPDPLEVTGLLFRGAKPPVAKAELVHSVALART